MNVFVELRREDLPQLRDALESQLPNSLAVYGLVDVMVRYGLEELGTKIFVANETPFGTFVVLTSTCSWEKVQSFTMYSKDIDQTDNEDESANEEFAKLLESVPGLDWGKPVYLDGCPPCISKKIWRLKKSGRLLAGLKYKSVSQAHAFLFVQNDDGDDDDDEILKQITLPEDYTLDNLSPEHTDWVHDRWLMNFSETKSAMRTIFSKLPSVAVFEKDPAENDAKTTTRNTPPVSWTMMYPDGALGNTFTLPEHRRKGLARSVTLSLLREVSFVGSPVFVYVDDENSASAAFHEKIGFRKVYPFVWEVYLPPNDSQEVSLSKRAIC
ncbi:glycine N-acyltransferase-like protein 3 [Oratosquilla oratoria]|uniref:glycine N-acyltransferase-like protein 3 n=1 Tax=Oratosquilla oratoria TaxID=337810 RepID=UPI003F76F4F9